MPRICGWAFQADIYCNDCMRPLAQKRTLNHGDATDYSNESTESVVRAWALAEGRVFDDTHDTNDFPMPILTSTEDAEGLCYQAGCGLQLLET